MKKFGLKKEERIYLREEIQHLFQKAQAFNQYPFRVLHANIPAKNADKQPLKFAVAVPKKRFKRAVDRNLLKRRTREAYRVNRNELKQAVSNKNSTLLFLFIYIGKEAESYSKIEEKIILILQQLQSIYAQDNQ